MSPDIIDEDGRVFGTVNVVDLLVSLLLVSVVIAGAALVFQSNAQAQGTSADEEVVTEPQTVVVQTMVPPYVADAIEDGSPIAEDVTGVSDVRVIEKITLNGTDAGTATRYRVRFTTTLVTQPDENGLPQFRDERLYVGQQVRLDLGTTIIDGVVVEMSDQ
jgi:hypothetical protein